MRKLRLLSTAAAIVLIGTAAASAQGMKKEEAPARAPAAQQQAPAEKVAPAMKGAEQKGAQQKPHETTGQAPKASDADKTRATQGGMDKDKSKGAATMDKDKSKSAMDKDKSMEKGPGAKNAAETKSPTNTKNSSDNMKPKTQENAQGPAGSKSSQSSTTAKPGAATTGQGAAAGSAKLSTEQRSKITTVIKQQKVERVEPSKLNVSISVGARIPDTVHFYPLPTEVVTIYPEWRGFDYILVGDEILVIDPGTHEIVAILDA